MTKPPNHIERFKAGYVSPMVAYEKQREEDDARDKRFNDVLGDGPWLYARMENRRLTYGPIRIELFVDGETALTFAHLLHIAAVFNTKDISIFAKDGSPLSEITWDHGEAYIIVKGWSL